MDEVDKEIEAALQNMIFIWDACKNYSSSQSDWEQHYQAAITVQKLYRTNINRFIHDPTTPDFLANLQAHIEKLEIYRDYGLLINP